MSLTEQERKDFMSLSSGQISDAMEELDIRRSVVLGLTLLGEPGSKIVGPAVTIRQVAKSADEPKTVAITRHREISRVLAKEGDVVVVDVGGRCDVASWGEYHGYHCQVKGVAGVIVDGATRDAPEIRASGFPTFVRGASPVKSRWDLKSETVNEPVHLGDVRVSPGDIVFADETGIVVITAQAKDRVLSKAIQIRDDEVKLKVK